MTGASSPVGGNTLREALAGHHSVGFLIGSDALQGTGWYCSCGEAYAGNEAYTHDAFAAHLERVVLAVVAPHLDAAETALGKVRAWASERDVIYPAKFGRTPTENYVKGYRCARADLRAALASAEATADTQEDAS